ncbi:MAG: response regulator [Candidatus Pacebacteria bacterium]|nr:response regulator [Candidatus Paceibacterota bacterium]
MRILIVEDHWQLALSLKQGLQAHYLVDLAYSGAKGKFKASTQTYGLIILDLFLPDTNGIALCQYLRKSQIQTPILLLTKAQKIHYRVQSLDAGADDYLTKPFDLREIKARIRALLRRPQPLLPTILQLNKLKLDLTTHSVYYDQQLIELTRKEFFILQLLMRQPGQVVNHHALMEQVWERPYCQSTNTLAVHIYRLRKKLQQRCGVNLIQTVKGIGYRLKKLD